MNTFLYTLGYTSLFSALIPMGMFLKKGGKGFIKMIFLLSFVSLLFDVVSRVMVYNGYRGLHLSNTYFIVLFFSVSYIFTQLLFNRKLIYTATALYAILFFFFILKFNHFNDFQSELRAIGSIVLLAYCALYYRQLLITLPAQNVSQYAPFWINTAVFIYFSFNLFLFIIANYVFKNFSNEIGMTVWGFHNINNIVKNILFAVGIYYAGKKQVGF